ncbi:response regulator transcription factor [Paenibacillus sp. NPDC058174]|uniref:response regulator transcription factor n=1 Tax=Paenibacillus sp. NPDC058174 TaxID=3346366 RepID=UPI0036DF17E5
MNNHSILLVDDEHSIVELMRTVLEKEGFTDIDSASSAEEALAACRGKEYDLIVLDVMMPGRSGIEAAPFLREMTDAPILFLTARTSDFDKLTGFAVGGDDYITKPFNPMEVVARMRSQLRRYTHAKRLAAGQPGESTRLHAQTQKVYDYGRFQVNAEAGELIVEGETVSCPALVFQLLLFLCENPNRIFSKSELYEQVWGVDAFNDDNTVMVHIHRIRERIEADPSNPQFIVNVRGLGYKLIQPKEKGIEKR